MTMTTSLSSKYLSLGSEIHIHIPNTYTYNGGNVTHRRLNRRDVTASGGAGT